MATQKPGFAVSYPELAAALLSSSEVAPRARLVAQQVASVFPDSAVVVYLFDEDEGWLPKATEGEVAFAEPAIETDAGTLGLLAEKQEAVLFSGAELPREQYAHLNIRRTVASFAGIPLMIDDTMVGAVEVLSFRQAISQEAVDGLADLSKIAALGLAAGATYENERNSQLESITRVTQMYDLEKVFNSNLEMDELLTMIAAKFQEVMDVQGVNLWMVAGDAVLLSSQAGVDVTTDEGDSQKPGEGIVGDMSDTGEPVLIDDPDDERLKRRNEGVEEGAIFSLVAAPILDRGALVGIAEAINPSDGVPFDEDDQFLLTTICETASNALHNASLLQAERKVEILETLVQVSQEITSTLNLDTVLHTVVDGPAAVIAYERAAVALERGGKLQIRAVSGVKEIAPGDPDVERLREILQWTALSKEEIFIRQVEDEIEADREETRAKFQRYFSESGMRAFYAIPLADDQGRVGTLSFESSDPDFLSSVHLEIIKVLAAQTTVALRNAQLYKEVPFIGVLEPLLQKKQKFMRMDKRRRTAYAVLAAAAALFLVFFPLPMRVEGGATVAPQQKAFIQPAVEGVIRKVYVREGDPVKSGAILADMEDWDYRAALAGAQAKYQTASAEMNRALAANDGTEAGIKRAQADYWAGEVTRAKERLERTHLRTPVAGVVATPHIEDTLGRHLELGDTFAEVVDDTHALLDVEVDESDLPLLQPGANASVKLESFPTRTFRGRVTVLSPKSETEGDHRTFFARVDVPNPEGGIRAGMQGRSKLSVGWRSAGYVLFRSPAMWFWKKLWSWFGW